MRAKWDQYLDKLMTVDSNIIRDVLIQQLQTDQRFGLRSVPVSQSVWQEKSSQSGGSRTQSSADVAANTKKLRIMDETQVKGCRKCTLCETRTQTVFGQGSAAARLVFVGEAPGFEEDKQGLAFVGKAGQLLTKMIVAMNLTRDDVYICNVLKCRPPNNRDPSADEILSCSGYLFEQLKIIQPEVIVTLGAPASKTLLNTAQSIGKLRGRFHDYFVSGVTGEGEAIPLMPTYHPAYLLRSPGEKQKTWSDLQMVMQHLGLSYPVG